MGLDFAASGAAHRGQLLDEDFLFVEAAAHQTFVSGRQAVVVSHGVV